MSSFKLLILFFYTTLITCCLHQLPAKMTKENLETRAKKAVISINSKVADIANILRDVSMELSHIIKYKSDYYYERGY